eukprot:g30528.t1
MSCHVQDDNIYKVCYQEDFSCEWKEQKGENGALQIRFDPHIKSLDQECIAANRDNTIEFEGGWKGDRVQFAKSCDDIAEPSEELFGQKKRAMWYQGEQLDGLKLCYKPDDSDAVPGYRASVKEQKDILLYIKKATLKNVISAFGPRIIPPNSETTMYFWGMWQNFEGQVHVGGKVCFAMEVTGCKACENGVRKAYDIETLDAVIVSNVMTSITFNGAEADGVAMQSLLGHRQRKPSWRPWVPMLFIPALQRARAPLADGRGHQHHGLLGQPRRGLIIAGGALSSPILLQSR